MEWNKDLNILIVGLGLIGGSYAKALSAMGYHVSALNRSQSSIEYALENGLIEKGGSLDDAELISGADRIVIGLYPEIIKDWILNNQKNFKSGAWITDVSGVKSSIVYDIQDVLRDDCEFIAAHPMAGREFKGVQYADVGIFKNANYIVVPTDKNTDEAIKHCEDLGSLLGFSKISVLSPEEHDEMIAYVSQLTHCIAVSLMTCNDNENVKYYTGDSFRDLTRIARINEDMWSSLFKMNKAALIKEMDIFINEFNSIRDMIANDDTENLKEKMRISTKRRMNFDDRRKND